MKRWSFQALALASGSADEEQAAKKELLAALSTAATLGSWRRNGSYRVVGRAELEELVREISREEADELGGDREASGDAAEAEEARETRPVAVTPSLLALAFQRLVGRDKREFLSYEETEATDTETEGDAQTPETAAQEKNATDPVEKPSRVYFLVDYPTSLPEINALLRLGEVGCASQETDSPDTLPLLPLIDGVLLLADHSAVRGRKSSSTNLPRNRGGSVVKVEGGGERMSMVEMSVFQASNPVTKMFYEAAQIGGIEWSDFIFTDVGCSTETSTIKQSDELMKEVLDTVETLAAQKSVFKAWVASTKFCVIPSTSSSGDDCGRDELYQKYESILSGVFPGSIAVSTVLYAMTESVAAVASPLNLSSPSSKSNNRKESSQLEEFVEHGDLLACRIANAQLCHEVLRAEGDPCFVPQVHLRLDEIERAMWRRSDLPGVGNEGRKAMPLLPVLPESNRSVRNTELATFYESPRFCCSMVHITRQLLQMEEELGVSWRGKLQSRAFMESLSRAILPQRIALIRQQNTPDECLSYYAPTDALLLALLPKTAPGRIQVTYWAARDHVRHRPAFKDWKREQLVSQEYLTPRTEAAAAACVPLSSGQLALVANQIWSIYPADHSVVRLYQTPLGLLWLTVYLHGETFGLRSSMQYAASPSSERKEGDGAQLLPKSGLNISFVASFQDESALHVSEGKRRLPNKPDKFPTITISNSFPSGLIVSACSDGSIIQRFMQTSTSSRRDRNSSKGNGEMGTPGWDAIDESENYRVIYGKGSVLRVLRCGRKEVMLASGYVCVIQDCKRHRHSLRTRSSRDHELQPPKVSTLTVDPETNALIERRPNGVIITTFTSGARVTYHVDGTRMYTNTGNTHVLVKKRGFADVCFDIEVNVTAERHAAGERVAVTKGGLRVRSVVNVYEGTTVEISYNTKVTAQVNGRVTTRKPNGQIIVAKDSGRVEYRSSLPSTDPLQSAADSKDDDDRDVTNHNGVYYFDCKQGCFQLCDNEQNQFRVNFCGADEEAGPTVSVDLAGEVSDAEAARYDVDNIPAKAVINEPIEPHIFILNGDGTGVEFLRPRDITEFIETAESENQLGEITEEESSSTRRHVYLRRLSAPGDVSRYSKPLFSDDKLHEEMLQLQRPVATAGKYLSSYFTEAERAHAQQQFTVTRRVEQIQPLSTDELHEMHAGWAKWEQWQLEREANKECYKVVDPRQQDVIAQEVAMQKKVLAAYKATRARKKMARQKAREMKAKSVSQELSPGLRMETVQEDQEALRGEGDDEDESDDEFGQFGSDLSDDDVGETADVDDPMELLWSAFSQADAEGRGFLSVAQTRLGVVNVLGIGVTTNELTEALVQFKIPYPFNVSFDVFADLVAFFRKGDEDNQHPEGSNAEPAIPSLKNLTPGQRKGHGTPRAAGSAAVAIRAKHNQQQQL